MLPGHITNLIPIRFSGENLVPEPQDEMEKEGQRDQRRGGRDQAAEQAEHRREERRRQGGPARVGHVQEELQQDTEREAKKYEADAERFPETQESGEGRGVGDDMRRKRHREQDIYNEDNQQAFGD